MLTRLIKQQSHSVIVNIICVALSTLNMFVVAGILGVEQFGVLAILLTLLTVSSAIQHLGINAGMTKLVASIKESENPQEIIREILLIKLCCVIFAGAIFYLVIPLVSYLLNRPYLEEYAVYIIAILLFSELSAYLESSVFALHKAHKALNAKLVIAVIRLVVIIYLTLNYNVQGYLIACIITYVFSSIYFYIYCEMGEVGSSLTFSLSRAIDYWRKIWETAKVSYVSKFANLLWLKTPIIFCSIFFTDIETGIVFFALQIGERLRTLSGSISVVSFPYMERLHAESPSKHREAVEKNFSYLFVGLCLTVLLAEFYFIPVYAIFAGDSFYGAQKYLPFGLVAGSCFAVANWALNFIIIPTGNLAGIVRFQIYNKAIFIFFIFLTGSLQKDILIMLSIFVIGDILTLVYFIAKTYSIYKNKWVNGLGIISISVLAFIMLSHGVYLLKTV